MSSAELQNEAAALTSPCSHPFSIISLPIPPAQPNEITLAISTVAINPVDSFFQKIEGLLPKSAYPFILGSDAVGTVHEIGSDVPQNKFKVGDRVLALLDYYDGMRSTNSAFQRYGNTDWRLVMKLPESIASTQAVVLPLTLATAAECLFVGLPKSQGGSLDDEGFAGMGLDLPGVPGSDDEAKTKKRNAGKIVLVWGGSSSVGSCAIQMCKAAGYAVATTASKKNEAYCKELGADYIFDHSKSSIVEDIVTGLTGKGELVGTMEAVQGDENIKKLVSIVERLGGIQHIGTVRIMPPEGLSEGITASKANALSLKTDKVGERIWHEWMTPALLNGSLKCKPDPVVVGHGLEAIQVACDRVSKGVSAQKLVVEL